MQEWIMITMGVVALAFAIRWWSGHVAKHSAKAVAERKVFDDRAARDRRACIALEKSLRAGMGGSDMSSPSLAETEQKGSRTVAPPLVGARATARSSWEPPSGHDPDLPAR